MIILKPLIWKTHNKRLYTNKCPHCGKDIKWIFDGCDWLPCDKEPVLFIMHPEGKKQIVYKRTVYENCLIYQKGDPRFGVPLQGNIQHYYPCEFLVNERKKFIDKLRRDK